MQKQANKRSSPLLLVRLPLPRQAVELASALQRSGLLLSQGEVAQLVACVRDSHNSVEYRPFVSKLYSRLHAQQAAAGSCSPAGAPPAGGSALGGVPAGAASAAPAAPFVLPQFMAARQRRLQTHVALALNQQPEALAAEAAEVAALPGAMPPAIPWHLPATKPFSKRMFERQVGTVGDHGAGPSACMHAPRACLLSQGCFTAELARPSKLAAAPPPPVQEEFGQQALVFSAWDPKAAEQVGWGRSRWTGGRAQLMGTALAVVSCRIGLRGAGPPRKCAS